MDKNHCFLNQKLLSFFAVLFCMALLTHGCFAEETLTIKTSMGLTVFDEYTATTGDCLSVDYDSEGIMDIIAQAYAIQDDKIDIFIFNANEGLYTLKEKGYYLPLQNNSMIAGELQSLYPSFAKAVCNGKDLVGWILYAQPIVRAELTDVLNGFGLSSPETFDDFLDVCGTLLQNESFYDDYVLTDVFPYNQKSIMNFYMRQFIMAYQLIGEKPDFKSTEFLSGISRIKNELPMTSDATQNFNMESEKSAVFSMPAAFEFISTRMLHMPRILTAQSSAIETYATIAVINPYSKNIEKAEKFLEYCTIHTTENAYFYKSTMTTPTENSNVIKSIEAIDLEISRLTSLDELTPDQSESLLNLQENRRNMEKRRYLVSQEDIDYYAQIVNDIFIDENSPFGYDAVLKQYVDRYLNRSLDVTAFCQLCQNHVEMIYQEDQ